MAQELWTEKYRPNCIADYVWRDEKQKRQVEQWVADKSIPNIMLSGSQGLGKTSLIHVLLKEIGVEPGDILEKNASEDVSIEMVSSQILGFASTIPYGDFKVIILEEADGLARSSASMQALKRIMEAYSDQCRFILTTNEPHKILPAIHSRCQTFHMTSLDRDQFQYRLAEILAFEEVEADIDTLDSYIEATYPDLRKSINSIQMNVLDGKLVPPSSDAGSKTDWMVRMIDLFKRGQISEAREFLCQNSDQGDYPEIYRYLYRNLQLWGDTETQREDAILAIRDGIVNDGRVGDREIALSATLVVLKNIRKSVSS